MAHTFQVGETTYIATGSAYNMYVASKTPCTLPDLDPEPAVDLLKLSAIEAVLGEIYRTQNTGAAESVPEWPEYERLTSNPVLAWNALYFLCHKEYSPEGRIAFIRSIDDRSYQPAMTALIGALADFFDCRQRPLTASALRTSMEAATILTDEAREELKTALTAETVVAAVKQRAGAGSPNSSAESTSGPATPGSKRSKRSKNSSGTPGASESPS